MEKVFQDPITLNVPLDNSPAFELVSFNKMFNDIMTKHNVDREQFKTRMIEFFKKNSDITHAEIDREIDVKLERFYDAEGMSWETFCVGVAILGVTNIQLQLS